MLWQVHTAAASGLGVLRRCPQTTRSPDAAAVPTRPARSSATRGLATALQFLSFVMTAALFMPPAAADHAVGPPLARCSGQGACLQASCSIWAAAGRFKPYDSSRCCSRAHYQPTALTGRPVVVSAGMGLRANCSLIPLTSRQVVATGEDVQPKHTFGHCCSSKATHDSLLACHCCSSQPTFPALVDFTPPHATATTATGQEALPGRCCKWQQVVVHCDQAGRRSCASPVARCTAQSVGWDRQQHLVRGLETTPKSTPTPDAAAVPTKPAAVSCSSNSGQHVSYLNTRKQRLFAGTK